MRECGWGESRTKESVRGERECLGWERGERESGCGVREGQKREYVLGENGTKECVGRESSYGESGAREKVCWARVGQERKCVYGAREGRERECVWMRVGQKKVSV